MRDFKATIEFTTPSLATWMRGDALAAREDDIDRFQRTDAGKIVFQPQWLFAAITGGILQAGPGLRDLNPSDIRIEATFDAKTGLYPTRSPSREGFGYDETVEREAILPGTRVTLDITTKDHVSLDKLRRVVITMGKLIGISPFGHAMGYGLFNLYDLIETSAETTPEGVWELAK